MTEHLLIVAAMYGGGGAYPPPPDQLVDCSLYRPSTAGTIGFAEPVGTKRRRRRRDPGGKDEDSVIRARRNENEKRRCVLSLCIRCTREMELLRLWRGITDIPRVCLNL